jgi:nitrogen-specific signal transduction histidine kinase
MADISATSLIPVKPFNVCKTALLEKAKHSTQRASANLNKGFAHEVRFAVAGSQLFLTIFHRWSIGQDTNWKTLKKHY